MKEIYDVFVCQLLVPFSLPYLLACQNRTASFKKAVDQWGLIARENKEIKGGIDLDVSDEQHSKMVDYLLAGRSESPRVCPLDFVSSYQFTSCNSQ